MVGSTVKRFHPASNRSRRKRILEGFDEEARTYFTVLDCPLERRSKRLLNARLEDIPVEARRKEAGKPLYITRYE